MGNKYRKLTNVRESVPEKSLGFGIRKILDRKSIFYGLPSFNTLGGYVNSFIDHYHLLPSKNDSPAVIRLKIAGLLWGVLGNINFSTIRPLTKRGLTEISFELSQVLITDFLNEITEPDEIFQPGEAILSSHHTLTRYRIKNGFLYTVSTSDVVIDIFISPEITKEDVISFLWENLGRIIQLEHSRDGYLKYVPAKIAQKKIFGSTNEIIAELNNDYSYFKENKLSRGYLLIGKPGTGKSAVVNSIIKNTEGSVFIINGLDTVESVEEMTSLFTQMRPDFIVFDDCDRSFDEPHFIKVVLGMLETIKEHNPCTNFLFTANTFSGILQDEAVTRKGRIDQIFEIPEPNEDDRREIFKGYIKDMGLDIPSEDFEKCIEFSDGLTGADIKELCIQLQRSTIDDVFERFKEIENLREKYSKDETSDLSILKKIAALADRED